MVRLLSSACVVVSNRLYSSSSAGLVGPAVKLMFHYYQLDASAIKPTGPKKNILKSDLLAFISEKKLKPKPAVLHKSSSSSSETPPPLKPSKSKGVLERPQNYVDIPLNNMRLTIAKRLSSSKSTIPHSYQSMSVCANNLLELRKEFVQAGTKVSVNDLIIKFAALALRQVPQINVQWVNEKITQIPNIDVSVAVATPSGLITPIIFGADRLNVKEISTRLQELAERARNNKLQLNEFQGGSFTVSNLGMYGISNFTAIINPPQTSILAIGGVRMELNEFDRPENIFDLTLCFDARAITDNDAQNFLGTLKNFFLQPETMIASPQQLRIAASNEELF